MGEMVAEVRGAVRALLRAPGFAAVVVVTLALGVGANTAVFTVLDAVILAELPYAEPQRLARVYLDFEGGGESEFLPGPAVTHMMAWDEVFEAAGAVYTYREMGADLTDGDRPTRITTTPASAEFFDALGVPPLLGRTFRPEESVAPSEPNPNRAPIANALVLSNGLWQRRFGGDPDVLGRSIRLDDMAYEIVGVMPPGFDNPFGPSADAWTPQDLRAGAFNHWGNFYLSGVVRLRRGLDIATATERAQSLWTRLEDEEPFTSRITLRLDPLHDDVVGETRRAMLWLLAGAAALVLLSACLNLTNIVFARGLARARDLALRTALGSGRTRLVTHVLSETAVLAALGGAMGLVVGWLGVDVLLSLAPEAIPASMRPELSARVFAFTLLVTLVALVACGLLPALRMTSAEPADVLRTGQRGSTGGRGLRRVRDVLVVTQVATGLVLLAGAGLLARSFASLRSVPLAVDSEGVLTFEVHLPPSRYPTGDDRQAFHDLFHQRLAELPGVDAVGATSWLPVNGRYHTWSFRYVPDGADPESDEVWHNSDTRIIHGDYFAALGIDLVKGVPPSEVDAEGEPIAWVNQSLVRSVFGDEDPMGRIVTVAGDDARIVGVIEDVPYDARGSTSNVVHVRHRDDADGRNWALTRTVRARGDLGDLRARAAEVLEGIDGSLVLHNPRPMDDLIAAARSGERFATGLMGVFAVLALALTFVGTYGVLAHSVAGRRREIGIRMALGAARPAVRDMVLRYAMGLVIPGLILGAFGTWLGSRWIRSLLFEVTEKDPWVLAGATAVVLGAGVLAGWVPARRATRVDPARTLSTD